MSARLLLSGVFLTGCLGLVAGCSSSPKKPDTTASVDQKETAEQEVVYVAKSMPRPQTVARAPVKNNQQQSAAQQKLAALKKRRHLEWEQQRTQQEKQAQYQREWQQKQAQQQQRQAQQQQQAQQQAQMRRPASGGQSPASVTYGGKGVGNYYAASLSGDFAGNRQLLAFIERMSRRGFNKNYLYGVFSQTRNRDDVARLWGNTGGGGVGGWYSYRSKFVTAANIQKGAQFWQQYGGHLQRASRQYGVDPEYIVGIMGVETRWGRILGKHRVIDALTTSAIVNQRRSDFFFSELENYLLMTRSERMDPLGPKGSYAGAMGYGQFMPSSFRAYAVDFDGDGVRDLWNPVDAIGSVANYFSKHGWRYGQEVAVPALVSNGAYASMPDGFKVKYSPGSLSSKGIQPHNGRWSNTERTHLLALTTVPGGVKEPWIGYHNFYVITRYNHSNYYAMAVHQLGQAIKSQAGGGKYAAR